MLIFNSLTQILMICEQPNTVLIPLKVFKYLLEIRFPRVAQFDLPAQQFTHVIQLLHELLISDCFGK